MSKVSCCEAPPVRNRKITAFGRPARPAGAAPRSSATSVIDSPSAPIVPACRKARRPINGWRGLADVCMGLPPNRSQPIVPSRLLKIIPRSRRTSRWIILLCPFGSSVTASGAGTTRQRAGAGRNITRTGRSRTRKGGRSAPPARNLICAKRSERAGNGVKPVIKNRQTNLVREAKPEWRMITWKPIVERS